MGSVDKVRFGLALAIGVFVPGLLDYLLSTAGYVALGRAVWAGGYLTAILLIWYVWLRPLDLHGATE